MFRQIVRVLVIGLLLLFALAGLLTPNRYWPSDWVRYREYRGAFDGRPVVLAPLSIRRATVPLEYHVDMTSGVCQISRVGRAGQIIPHASMGQGYVGRDAIPTGEGLQLDPGSGTGHYLVRVGLKYHPLSPFLWRLLGGGMLGGTLSVLVAGLIVRRRKPAWLTALNSAFSPLQWATLVAVAVFSAAFLYPAVHESGHALAGMALGGEVREVLFTPLSGEEPHVSFGHLPEEARPWMQAGGVFLPILVAYGVLIVWLVLGRRLSGFSQTLLLTPALLFLFSSFGTLFDDHLLGMALRLGFDSPLGILLIKSVPIWFTLAAYAIVGWRIWLLSRLAGTGCSGVEEPLDPPR